MKEDDFGSYLAIVAVILAVILAFIFMPGCASAPPSLAITEAEIDAKIESLTATIPKDPTAVVYNETSSVYEVKPDVFKRAVRDGIVKYVQDDKIKVMEKYLAENPPTTFWDKVKLFGIGYLLGVITGAAGGIYISQ